MRGMLNKKVLLDIIRNFVVFEQERDTKENVIRLSKKIAAYHQYHAVIKAIDATLKASSVRGDKRCGVVWHTQGSGKSLIMAFYTGKLVLTLDNPTIVVLTDRNDLDDQLFGTFSRCSELLRQAPVQAESRLVLDPETHQSFTIKRYRSKKENFGDGQWRHKKIILSPDNKDFKDIVLENVSGEDFRVVAEFIEVLG